MAGKAGEGRILERAGQGLDARAATGNLRDVPAGVGRVGQFVVVGTSRRRWVGRAQGVTKSEWGESRTGPRRAVRPARPWPAITLPRIVPHRAPCPHPVRSSPPLATPCARPTYRRLLVPTTTTTCPTRPTPAGPSLKLPAAARPSSPCPARPSPALLAITFPTLAPRVVSDVPPISRDEHPRPPPKPAKGRIWG